MDHWRNAAYRGRSSLVAGAMATLRFMNQKMKAAQVGKPGEDFELVERNIPEPGAGQVRLKVEYPRVPGHEIGDLPTVW